MDQDELRAQRLQQQVELGAAVIRLFTARSVDHVVEISTLIELLAFLVPTHPCCIESSANALLNLGLHFAELARRQEPALVH